MILLSIDMFAVGSGFNVSNACQPMLIYWHCYSLALHLLPATFIRFFSPFFFFKLHIQKNYINTLVMVHHISYKINIFLHFFFSTFKKNKKKEKHNVFEANHRKYISLKREKDG